MSPVFPALTPGGVDGSLHEPPYALVCPITGEVMTDPVLVMESGHTYERAAITQWFEAGNRTDPMTNVELRSTLVGSNIVLKGLIEAWKLTHPRASLVARTTNRALTAGSRRGGAGAAAASPPPAAAAQAQVVSADNGARTSPVTVGPNTVTDNHRLWLDAERGVTAAQVVYGLKHRSGADGVRKDMRKAAEWFRRAAEQRDPEGLFHYGWCMLLGQGVERDLESAFRMFNQGAQAGHARSQLAVGLCYRGGMGVDVSEEASKAWLRKAAAKGSLSATVVLQQAMQVKVQEQALLDLQEFAEKQEDPLLMYCLALGYYSANDVAAGFKWLKRSAKLEFSLSENARGCAYWKGYGSVPKSRGLAEECFQRAIEGGCKKAEKNLAKLRQGED